MKKILQFFILTITLSACATGPSSNWLELKCHLNTKQIEEKLKPLTKSLIETIIDEEPVYKLDIGHRRYEYQGIISNFVVEKANTATFGIGLPSKEISYLFRAGPYVEVNYLAKTALMRYMIALKGRNQFDEEDSTSMAYITAVEMTYNCE